VGDVAQAAARVLQEPGTAGETFELGGPEIMTLREIMELVLKVTHRRRMLLPLPFALARIQGAVLGILPKPLITPDQVRLLERDNVVSEGARGFRELAITPEAAEAIIPSYLWRFRKQGQFEPVAP
jgi:NADH dehydrogenase